MTTIRLGSGIEVTVDHEGDQVHCHTRIENGSGMTVSTSTTMTLEEACRVSDLLRGVAPGSQVEANERLNEFATNVDRLATDTANLKASVLNLDRRMKSQNDRLFEINEVLFKERKTWQKPRKRMKR